MRAAVRARLDAFSGTCANPLVAEASRLLVVAGGPALLAETDELIGAEEYVLRSVRDLPTARRFLTMVGRFQRATRRRTTCSAESTTSGIAICCAGCTTSHSSRSARR